jgi:hypothetical protein
MSSFSLYYNAADQANARATSLVYSTATPGGASALAPSVSLAKSTNPTPSISTFLTPLYASAADANSGTGIPVAYLSYLQNLSRNKDATFTVSTNNYSVYDVVQPSSSATNNIQFTIITNASPFKTNTDYATTPISKSGRYLDVDSITVNVNSAGLRKYTFNIPTL